MTNRLLSDIPNRWLHISKAILDKTTNPTRFEQIFIGTLKPPKSRVRSRSNYRSCYNHRRPKISYLADTDKDPIYLTPREAQCVALVLQNYTNRKIGSLLKLSPRTIEFYLKNIRQKTGCHNKAHLIAKIKKSTFCKFIDNILKEILCG